MIAYVFNGVRSQTEKILISWSHKLQMRIKISLIVASCYCITKIFFRIKSSCYFNEIRHRCFEINFKLIDSYYAFHGRVTLFFAKYSLAQCRITMEFLHNFFLNHEVIFSSHTMFINTSTKEFNLVNNAFPSHDIALEHFLYYKMVANVH